METTHRRKHAAKNGGMESILLLDIGIYLRLYVGRSMWGEGEHMIREKRKAFILYGSIHMGPMNIHFS